jgi:hypothetical protein
MTVLLDLVMGTAVVSAVLESSLRMYRWRFAPPRLRILYALFLLNDEAVQAIAEIHQRVERAAARSFDELFELYAVASGKSKDDVEAVFGFRMPWRQLIRSRLVLRNRLQWHVGLVPIPDQPLRTTTITGAGTRSTGRIDSTAGRPTPAVVKHVVLSGGSVPYGYGATCDDTTIAGRLQEHLNRSESRRGRRWEVINRAFPAATSFQELIVALQTTDLAKPPDYVVSISGCNDVGQQFSYGETNVSALAQGYTNSLERRGLWTRVAGAP